MNVKKIKVFGNEIVFQDKDLKDPRLFELKGTSREKKL